MIWEGRVLPQAQAWHFLHFFHMRGRCLTLHGSSVIKLKCNEYMQ